MKERDSRLLIDPHQTRDRTEDLGILIIKHSHHNIMALYYGDSHENECVETNPRVSEESSTGSGRPHSNKT